jgi:hypothetical protein
VINLVQRSRQRVYVCCGFAGDKIINQTINAASKKEAALFYINQFKIEPKDIFGPFVLVKEPEEHIDKNDDKKIKFSGKMQKAVYNDWIVNAIFLIDPKDYAYLVYISREDGKKEVQPKGINIIPISNLRFI